MPTYSRVNKPLMRVSAREGQAFKEQSGGTEQAIAGDGNGNVNVLSTDGSFNKYGMVWIRLKRGVDPSTQTALTTPPIRALAKEDFYPADNMPIRVSLDPVSGLYRIEGNDTRLAAQGGLNVNGLNTQAPAHSNRWLRDIRNLRVFFPTTNTLSTMKASVEPYLYVYNGTIYNAQKGQTDNIDFTSYVPSSGLERLVGAALLPDSNTIQLVSGSTRAISAAPWTVANLQELIDGFDVGSVPMQAVRVRAGATALRNEDVLFELRQVIGTDVNGLGTLGYPNPVTNSQSIREGYTLIVEAPFEISSGGSLTIESGGSLVTVNPEKHRSYAPRTVTSDYTITDVDRYIFADASASALTITLPDAANYTGMEFDVKAVNTTGGSITLATTSSQTIDGETTQIISTQYENLTMISNGSEWLIL